MKMINFIKPASIFFGFALVVTTLSDFLTTNCVLAWHEPKLPE